MTYSRFFSLLAIFTLIALGGVAAAHALLPLAYAVPLSSVAVVLLLVLCIGIFWLGKRTATSENKFLFGNVFMGVTMLKLFLCGGLIGAYIYLGNPENKYFVIPFFFAYLVYTVLEIVCLVKLAAEGR
ncbi:MAG: hypothetical protein AAGF89_10490 [Bacteroidota bacterium]